MADERENLEQQLSQETEGYANVLRSQIAIIQEKISLATEELSLEQEELSIQREAVAKNKSRLDELRKKASRRGGHMRLTRDEKAERSELENHERRMQRLENSIQAREKYLRIQNQSVIKLHNRVMEELERKITLSTTSLKSEASAIADVSKSASLPDASASPQGETISPPSPDAEQVNENNAEGESIRSTPPDPTSNLGPLPEPKPLSLEAVLKQKVGQFSWLTWAHEGLENIYAQLGEVLKKELDDRETAIGVFRNHRILTSRLNEQMGQYSNELPGIITGIVTTSIAAKKEYNVAKAELAARRKALIESQSALAEAQRLSEQIEAEHIKQRETDFTKINELTGKLEKDGLSEEEQSELEKLKARTPTKGFTEEGKYKLTDDEREELLKENNETIKTLNSNIDRLSNAVVDAEHVVKTKFASIINKTMKSFMNVSKEMDKIVGDIRKLQNDLGVTAGVVAAIKVETFIESAKSAATSIFTGGKLTPVSAGEIEKAISDFRQEFGGIIDTSEAREFAEAATRMGVSTQQLAAARRTFLTSAMADTTKAIEQQEKFIDAFTKQGTTFKDALALDFVRNSSELIARSGERFLTSLGRAAGEARKIGVELSKVNQLGDNIIGNFEGFLDSMAELGAMGFGFDTFRMAQIAETGDVGALFDELRSQLAVTGKDLTDLRRSEQLALSSAFGMNIEDFQRLAADTPDVGREPIEVQKLTQLVNLMDGLSKLIKTTNRVLGIIQGILGVGHLLYLKKIADKINPRTEGSDGIISKIKNLFNRTPKTPDASNIPSSRLPGGTMPSPSSGQSNLPSTSRGGADAPGTLDKLLQIKPAQLLAAGAAMIMIAGATFILAKAMQQFSDGVTWQGVLLGIGSLVALTVATIKVGAAMTLSSKFILIGAAAMAVMAGSLWILGKAFGAIGTGIATTVSAIASIGEQLDGVISKVGGIGLLSLALTGLAISLAAVASAGLLALPTLLGIGAIVGGVGAIASLVNRKKSKTNDTEMRPGYGEQTLVTPEQTVALHNDDNIVAYADDMIANNTGIELLSKGALLNNANTEAKDTVVTVDMSSLEKKLDQVIAAVSRMQINMDGVKVGQVLSNSEGRAMIDAVYRTQRLTSGV